METEPVLLVPETRGSDTAGATLYYGIGYHDGIGFSPFSIESPEAPGDDLRASACDVLAQLTPMILDRRGTDRLEGFVPPVTFEGEIDDSKQSIVMGDYRLTVNFVYPYTPIEEQNVASHGAMILQMGPEDFIIAWHGVKVSFDPVDGKWKPGRLLNGDQTHQGRLVRLPRGVFSMQRVILYRYP